MITLTWIAAAILSAPVLLLSYQDTKNIINNGKCVLTNSNFIIYGSICSFIIPTFVMSLMYCLSVKRLNQFLKTFNNKSMQTKEACSQKANLINLKTNKAAVKTTSSLVISSSKMNNKLLSNCKEEAHNFNQLTQNEVHTSNPNQKNT